AVVPFRFGNLTSNGGPGTTRTTSGGPEAELGYKAFNGPGQGQEVIGRSLFLAANYQFTDNLSGYVQAVVGRSESNAITDRGDVSGITMRSIWAPRIAIDNVYVPQYVRDVLSNAGLTEFQLHRDGGFIGVRDLGDTKRD